MSGAHLLQLLEPSSGATVPGPQGEHISLAAVAA